MLVTAIILAAGKGSRIGCPKWQLKHGNETFLSSIINKLICANIQSIVCVINANSIPPTNGHITFTINPHPEHEMISSIYYGIQTYKNSDGYLIMPVDYPYIKATTINKLCAAFAQHHTKVIKPTLQNKSGHPIIIPHKLAQLIPNSDIQGGLRQFLLAHNASFLNISVQDSGILKNINLAADL
jgi:CTP:molybdopterin cytidylyltransferase MocA